MPRVIAPIGTPVQFYGSGEMTSIPFAGQVVQCYGDGRHDIAILQRTGVAPTQVKKTVFHEGDPSLKDEQYGPGYVNTFGLFRLPPPPQIMTDELIAAEKDAVTQAAEQRQAAKAEQPQRDNKRQLANAR